MIEKNYDILLSALKNMPTRKPKLSSWDNISDGLNLWETDKFISQNKENLPQYKAPASAWSGITSALPTSFSTMLSSGSFIIISVLILLVGLTASLLLLNSSSENDNNDQIQHSTSVGLNNISEIREHEPISEKNQNMGISNVDESILIADPTETKLSNQVLPGENKSGEVKSPTAGSNPSEVQNQNANINSLINTSPTPAETGYEFVRLISKSQTQILASNKNSKNLVFREAPINDIDRENSYVEDFSGSLISFGIYYSYNHFQKTDYEGMSAPQYVSSFGFEIEYEKKNWFIKLGLGYLNWKEDGNYTFDYDQNQLVYSYNYVDSAFISPDNGITHYFTSEVDIFDSISQQKLDQTTYDYKSLQIPILLGYKLINRSKFDIALLGGFAFDFRVSGKQYIPEFNEQDASVTSINNSLIHRTKTNWRAIIGININYSFTERWSLYAEPTYQKYLTPLYSPNSIKGGNMFNVKFGIKYSF